MTATQDAAGQREAASSTLIEKDGVVELPAGGTIRTYPPPPPGFDPLQAGERELLLHGFPARPADANLLKLWESMMRPTLRLVRPAFQPLDLPRPAPRPFEDNTTLAGATGPDTIGVKSVNGFWNVPNVYPPGAAKDGVWYSTSTFMGTGTGIGVGNFFKVGVQCRVLTTFGSVVRQFITFCELSPGVAFQVVALPVSAGDMVRCSVVYDDISGATAGSAQVAVANRTALTGTTFFTFTPPSGNRLPTQFGLWGAGALAITDPTKPKMASFGFVFFRVDGATNLGLSFNAGGGDLFNLLDPDSPPSLSARAELGLGDPGLVIVSYSGI